MTHHETHGQRCICHSCAPKDADLASFVNVAPTAVQQERQRRFSTRKAEALRAQRAAQAQLRTAQR